MTKFKVGDRVRYTGKDKRYNMAKAIGAVGVVLSYDIDDVKVKWDKGSEHAGSGGKFDDNLELIAPTGFEVGKKYVGKDKSWRNGIVILAELDDGDFAISYESTNEIKVDKIHPSAFQYYEEYIPPPPEEWRIVYKDQYGNITVGKTPFKSESEVKASRYWTDHSSSFKTIRVDA